MFALSTAWNAKRHNSGRDIALEIKNLGINTLELNWTLSQAMVEEISQIVTKGELKVVSLHNFCPCPEEVELIQASPDYYSLSSLDRQERENALYWTKNTIRTASRLEAGVVVLHMGRVEVENRARELLGMIERGLMDTSEYHSIARQMKQERSACSGEYLKAALESLKVLGEFARGYGVRLGIETRYYYREVPSFEEIGILLEGTDPQIVGYWHDVGHAQIFENLGLAKHRDYLEAYGERLIGFHLHDIRRTKDHQAPGSGEFNFSLLLPYLKTETLKVLEIHSPATGQDIIESIGYLEEIFYPGLYASGHHGPQTYQRKDG